MKGTLLLINPPVSRFDSSELAPPLGLLELAERAGELGREVYVLDLNLPAQRALGDHPEGFYEQVLEEIALFEPREIGLTSMGVNSHVALEIARLAKKRWSCEITVGGVHLSSIEGWIAHECPFVDRVATPDLRSSLEGQGKWWGELSAESIPDRRELERLFSYVDLDAYFGANPRRLVNYEWGRGCKYNCAFCYSPAYYHGWSVKEPNWIVDEMHQLGALGVGHIFLVEDNLLNSVRWLEQVAERLAKSTSAPSWNGYATFPELKRVSFELLAGAGCVDLYVGVDTVNLNQQKAWRKRFVREWQVLFDLVGLARRAGMSLTCSYILDLGASPDPLEEALGSALGVRAFGGGVRLSVLTRYPASDLEVRTESDDCAYDEFRVSVLMDLPLVVVENPHASAAKHAFPWHSRTLRSQREWERSVLSVLIAQEWLNNSELPIEFPVSAEGGRHLWRECLEIADMLENVVVSKLELKSVVRRLIREHV